MNKLKTIFALLLCLSLLSLPVLAGNFKYEEKAKRIHQYEGDKAFKFMKSMGYKNICIDIGGEKYVIVRYANQVRVENLGGCVGTDFTAVVNPALFQAQNNDKFWEMAINDEMIEVPFREKIKIWYGCFIKDCGLEV